MFSLIPDECINEALEVLVVDFNKEYLHKLKYIFHWNKKKGGGGGFNH